MRPRSVAGFAWDQRKARTNLRTHGVDFAAAATVFEGDHAPTPRTKSATSPSASVPWLESWWWLTPCAGNKSGSFQRGAPRSAGARSTHKACEARIRFQQGQARRGGISKTDKTRITIRLDDAVLSHFRKLVHRMGGGNYKTLINEALREHVRRGDLETTVRRAVREELHEFGLKRANAERD